MKCPYISPTVQQCEKCSFIDCVRDERQDHNDYNREWNHNHPERHRETRKRYCTSHPERNKLDCHNYYQKVKDTEEYKAAKHEYYMKRKNTPEYKVCKMKINQRYRERLKAERVS